MSPRFYILIMILASAQPVVLPSISRADTHSRAASCLTAFDQLLKRIGLSHGLPPNSKTFKRDFKALIDKHGLKSSQEITAEYLNLSFHEWANLGDPNYHLTVLKYPVPAIALDALEAALQSDMTPKAIARIIETYGPKSNQKNILTWIQKNLEQPEFKDVEELQKRISAYKKTQIITRNQVRYFSGIPIIPDPKSEHARLYKGSNFYKGPALS